MTESRSEATRTGSSSAELQAIAETYIHGGPGGGVAVRANVAAWEGISLFPRVLRDVTRINTEVSILGVRSPVPVLAAPWAGHALVHPEAEKATAQGLAAAGIPMIQSSSSSVDVAEVGRHSGPFWQQIYVPQDRSLIDGFLDRVVSAGASALVLTVDQPAAGNTLPFRADLSRLAVNGVLPGGRGNFSDLPPGTPLGTATDLGPADIERLLRRTGLPIVVKGVLRADDARTAIDAGASAVVVSNHGGRQLACGVPTARALAGVVEAVEGRVPVLVDSGVRNGEHVIKACALGAAAVLIGRPVARALQQDGAAGVTAWGRELIADVHRTFALCGVADLSQVTEDLVISA